MSGKGSPVEKYGYDAVIPAEVLFNKDLSDRAKILYALLRNLSYQTGYAFARNERLREFFGGCSEATISRLLKQLVDAKAIRIENGEGGRQVRKIFVGEVYLHNLRKNEEVNLRKNEEVTNNSINNNKNNKGGRASDDEIKDWISIWVTSLGFSAENSTSLISDFLGFVEARKAKGKPFLTIRAVAMQANKLIACLPPKMKVPKNPMSKAKKREMLPDPQSPEAAARMRYMLRASISHNWEEVYAIDERSERDFWTWACEDAGMLKPASGVPMTETFGDGDAGWL